MHGGGGGAAVAVATAAAALEVTAGTADMAERGPAATAQSRPSRNLADGRRGGREPRSWPGHAAEPWTGRKQTTGRLVVGLLLAAVVLIIILAAVGVL